MAVAMARRRVKAKAEATYVTLIALGNQAIQVRLTASNRKLGVFLRKNIPADWNLDQFEVRVNDRKVENDFILNAQDQVTFAPNVAGGR